MGMFDTILCEFPLPIKKFQKNDFQTKDTPNQFLDLYKIKENGTLWRETYEIEDRSDPNAEGLKRMFGCMTRVNKKWVRDKFTGQINFYDIVGESGWIEFSAIFKNGKTKKVELVEYRYSKKKKAQENEVPNKTDGV